MEEEVVAKIRRNWSIIALFKTSARHGSDHFFLAFFSYHYSFPITIPDIEERENILNVF